MRVVIANYHPSTLIGGSEIQCSLLAEALTKRGHEVHYFSLGSGATGSYSYHVVEAASHLTCDFKELLKDVEPDVAYWRGGRYRAFSEFAVACRQLNIPYTFGISSISNTEPRTFRWPRPLRPIDPRYYVKLYRAVRRAIRARSTWHFLVTANGVTCLSESLAKKMAPIAERQGQPLIQLNNSMSPDAIDPFEWNRPYVSWVANLKRQKNPEDMIALAKLLEPDGIDVLMAGAIQDRVYSYFENPKRLPSNLHYLGKVTVPFVYGMVGKSVCLVHTCSPEGFGNIFIQAWQVATPTLTLRFDPDDLIKTHGLGYHAGSIEEVAGHVRELSRNAAMRQAMGSKAQQFANERYSIEANAPVFEAFLQDVVTRHTGSR